MADILHVLTQTAWKAIGGSDTAINAVKFVGSGSLPSAYRVTDVASAAIAVAGMSIAELLARRNGDAPSVTVDRRLSSFWFRTSIRPIGWSLPALWDPIAGDYQTNDGWIRLHTNAPHHRAAAEHVLGSGSDKVGVARAVALWKKTELEAAIVESGGCAAEMRSTAEWAQHPQGMAVAGEPLVHVVTTDPVARPDWPVPIPRPLTGLRVLDLTRVLAGPVAARLLAVLGAQVLRIDPPGWDEPAVVPEVTLGKRCARLDLRQAEDRSTFEALLSKADVLLHGYRPGALDRLGFDPAVRRTLSPGLVDVCLCAYGWSGPWASRRGFDSLVQMSSGIADTGMAWRKAARPLPLPVQALDHATGYLMAATAMRGVTRRLTLGGGTEGRLSLARTARLLVDAGLDDSQPPLAPETTEDLDGVIEATDWGNARRLVAPISIPGVALHGARPARRLGSDQPQWQ